MAKKFKLRKHQKKMNKLALKELKTKQHVIYTAPTGFGKGLCILELTRGFIDDGARVLVLAPYRKLVSQLMDVFSDDRPALVMGSDSYGNPRTSSLVVASLNTISRRLKSDKGYLGDIDYIIIDEVHRAFNIPNKKPQAVVKPIYDLYWNKSKFLGFTATPITASGYRLEGWDSAIFKYNTGWLIKKGWLAKFKYFSTKSIDTRGLKLQRTGDYKVSDMEEVTNNASAITTVMDNYDKYCIGKKTLLFAVSILHGELLEEAFREKNVSVALIHSNLTEAEQQRVLNDFKYNAIDVLINIAMLTTGFDDPEVECLMIARPVGSLSLAIQIFGRVLRVHKDLGHVNIIDLTGVHEKVNHLPDDNFNFNRVKGAKSNDSDDNPSITDVVFECPHCNAVSRMVDCKRETELTDELSSTIYYCPECHDVIEEKSVELGSNEVTEIKTASAIDFKKTYDHKDIMQVLGELITDNTRSAKTSWGVHIHRTCMRKDKKRYREAFYGYAQGVYGSAKSWKRIMDIYGS